MKQFAFITILLIASFSCSRKNMAPIEYKGHIVYDKNSTENNPKETQYKYGGKEYKVFVNKGDSVYSIARKQNILMSDLISKNNIKPPYIIRVGDELIIPKTNYHKVQKGESLYSISKKYNISIGQLNFLNNLDNSKIIINQILAISTDDNKPDNKIIISQDIPKIQSIKQKKITKKYNNFSWPCKGKIISSFGNKGNGLYNDGVNIESKKGALVLASEKGKVVYAGNGLKGYGNLIIIKHSNDFISSYAHLDRIKVRRDDLVEKSKVIAYVGNSGNVDSPQTHFSLRKKREAINPESYIKKKLAIN
jgi:murein DD-endopeptidase MepM/ murein hydrolase activator NlpD